MTAEHTTCVYTCLIGGYETLNEQPIVRQSKVPFLCLTDDPELTSETWRIVRVDRLFGGDSIRSQRMLKLLPHHYLPDFDRSLYIDNTVVLKATPEEILGRYLTTAPFVLPFHSQRQSVIDEFAAILALSLDEEVRVSEQLAHYQVHDPAMLQEPPYWTAILMRDHRDPLVRETLHHWASHVLRYSRRDQLSANHAFRHTGLAPLQLEIDNLQSWFHRWPVKVARRDDVRTYDTGRAASAEAPALHRLARELQAVRARLAQEQRHVAALQGSRSWRFTAPLRAIMRRLATPPAAEFVVGPSGHRIYVERGDERGAHLIKSGGDFNPPSLTMWRALVAQRDWTHIVDVGANYGEMLVNVPLPKGASVVALEPNPHLLPYLERTLREAELNVEIVMAAASDRNGMSMLHVDRTWSGMSSLVPVENGHEIAHYDTPSLTLAPLIRARAKAPPRLLVKIDVEGHEIAVLRGLEELLPETEHFAALVEVLHVTDNDLDWLLARFTVALLEQQSGSLVPADATSASELRALLKSGRFYPQDVVLGRK